MIGFILLLAYAVFAGIVEAVLWSRKGHEATKHNEHIALAATRVILFIVAIIKVAPLAALAALLCFPFVHNGFYYEGRNLINEKTYPKGWRSEPSEDSTADINFSFKTRTIAAVVGIVMLAVFLFIKH